MHFNCSVALDVLVVVAVVVEISFEAAVSDLHTEIGLSCGGGGDFCHAVEMALLIDDLDACGSLNGGEFTDGDGVDHHIGIFV